MKLQNGSGSIVELSGNRRKKYAVRVTVGWRDGSILDIMRANQNP